MLAFFERSDQHEGRIARKKLRNLSRTKKTQKQRRTPEAKRRWLTPIAGEPNHLLGGALATLLSIVALSATFSAQPAFCNGGKAETAKAAEPQYHADADLIPVLKRIEGQDPDVQKQALQAFRLSTKAEKRVQEKSAYVLARILQKGGTSDELKQAVPLYQEAAHYEPLYLRCQFHLTDCANTLGDEALVRESFQNILNSTKNAMLKAQAEYGLAQSYVRAGETAEANQKFETVLKIGPSTQFALGARYYLGQSAFQDKNLKEGMRIWRDYLAKGVDGRFAKDIVTSLTNNTDIELTPADHKTFGDYYYAHGDWDKALTEWKKAPAPVSWFKQGNCMIKSGRKQDGKDFLIAGITDHADDSDVIPAAKLLAFLGTHDEAVAVWTAVQENCPKQEEAALYNLAYRAKDQEAVELYTQLTTKYPDSEYAPEAHWWLAWDRIKSENYKSVLNELKSCAAKYDKLRQGARFSYWIGKVAEKEQQPLEAKKAYEETANKFGNNYYGWRARARLNSLAGKPDIGWSTEFDTHLNLYTTLQSKGGWSWPTPPAVVPYKQIVAHCGETEASLVELHQWDECLEILPQDTLPELRAMCLAKMSLVREAINTASRDLQGKPNAEPKWQMAYPLLHSNVIGTESSAKQVDPFLAHALIREESRYNVRALSGSNAIGLMQLMPATAMGVAKRLGVSIKSNEDIHKPENNLKLGIDYLSYTINRFKGNAMLAVASYNGGPNAVASWTKRFSMDDPDYFVENIPFTETRDYVRKVFGSYWNYSAIYKAKAQATATASAGTL